MAMKAAPLVKARRGGPDLLAEPDSFTGTWCRIAAFGYLPTGLHRMRERFDLRNGYFSFSGGQTGALAGTEGRTIAAIVFDFLMQTFRTVRSGSGRTPSFGAVALPHPALVDFAGKRLR